jgi:hypothetical protein
LNNLNSKQPAKATKIEVKPEIKLNMNDTINDETIKTDRNIEEEDCVEEDVPKKQESVNHLKAP